MIFSSLLHRIFEYLNIFSEKKTSADFSRMFIVLLCTIYKAHKIRGKDDLKLYKYDDPKFKLSLLPWIWSLNGLFYNLSKKSRRLYSCRKLWMSGNRQCNSVQSSLKYHSFWVTLYIHIKHIKHIKVNGPPLCKWMIITKSC